MLHTIDLQFFVDHAIAAFVVETSAGPVLIESGPHSVFPHLKDRLGELGYQPSDIKHVLLTHIHFDHAGAAWAFAKEGATTYVHPKGYKHLHDPEKLYNSAKRIYGDQMEHLWGLMEGIPESQLVAVEDEQTLEIGDTKFKAWFTPGHASHHIAWQWGDQLFTGDVAGCKIEGGPISPPCPPPDIDIEAWMSSIQRIRDLAPKTLHLTHFGEIHDVEGHLNGLVKILEDWKAWMKTPFEAGKSVPEIVPEFKAYAAAQLKEAGLDDQAIARYEAANPAWMSVAGLMRYWKKKTEAEATL
ncbi:MBL fold metallo-hydrolase [Pontibacter sp. G13]|uniref:MBL fold metallo-hydrolase n=1 Tax=Pontibacter sp. G13 TaxID=3074898 RepID=UPI00288BB2FE|nr:MBL fold metallo-hydrolase [Pontibacter sp. G13]WNJ16047.1 MBL fold metallo-hydrolase [Pontibacter sp. G13]